MACEGEPRRAAAWRLIVLASLALAAAWPCGWRGARAGETRCWIDKGALVAPAAFGDVAGDFLIDLSAPTSGLHVTRAQADGMDGEAATRDLAVAGERLDGVTLAIVDLDARTAKFDTTINGVIGADLLRRFIVEIDPSPCRLRLSLRGSRASPPRWRRAVRLPIGEAGGRPLAPARVTDGARVRAGLFAIDTADWTTRVAGAGLSRPQSADAPAPVRLRAVDMGGRLFEQVPARVQPPGDAQVEDAIGMAVWSRWRLRLDIRDGWLDLAPAASPVTPPQAAP